MSAPREHLLTTEQSAQWRQALPASRSVFGSVEFAQICEQYRGQSARLHVIESEAGSTCSAMLLRSLSDLPFQAPTQSLWDVTTPDYTGPMRVGQPAICAEEFRLIRTRMMLRERIVAEFAHLHPWDCDVQLLGEGVEFNRDIVWVDATQPPDVLYGSHLEHSCRKNIQKAQRDGVEVSVRSSDEDIAEFFRIYSGTMQRHHALGRYAFSLEYFMAIRDLLPQNARFTFAHAGGRAIAATLYMTDDENVYAYLGGADAEFNTLRPTNLLVWKTIEWAHLACKKRVVLGGGYGPEDGIFRFKATFSKLRQPFYTYRKIHNPDDYEQLDARSRVHHDLKEQHVSYFPSYRYSL